MKVHYSVSNIYCIVVVFTSTVIVLTCFECAGVLVICVLVFTVFCSVCSVFLVLFLYVYLF